MSFVQVSSSRLGHRTSCPSCGAGGLISFDWEYAKTSRSPEHRRDLSVFVRPRELRYGVLYECVLCRHPWYLCGEPAFMNFVPPERLELIEKWNEHPIILRQEPSAQLGAIGRTPPDQYGNGRQFHETPCAITTVSGEQINLAIVSVQRHAPFEEWRDCRLASDIAAVHPSPYALPLTVRAASSQADEIRMGFAPTMIEAPNGELLALNGTQNFLVSSRCKASEVVVSNRRLDWSNSPALHGRPDGIVYFVADGLTSPG